MQRLEKTLDGNLTNSKSLIRRAYDFGKKYIDYKMGVGGAVIMGGIVFGVNYFDTHEVIGSTTAALKQGGYTFLFGGAVMRGCEYLATKIESRTKALIASVIIPSLVSISLTYGVHSMKGTPKPVESTIPTAALVIPSTAIWGITKRKQLELIA